MNGSGLTRELKHIIWSYDRIKGEATHTLGVQRERLKFEKQPSQTIVRGAYAAIS